MPYLYIPPVSIGPVTVHAFGVIAVAAVLLGARAMRLRAAELGLDVDVVDRFMPWLIPGIFAGAHLMAVLAYYPERIAGDPLIVLRFWDGLSSFGGILGGLVTAWLFFRGFGLIRKYYLHALLFGAVVGLLVGRFGCAVTHDHPGTITTSPIAVQGWPTSDTPQRTLGFYTEGLRRHDLGLYEFLFLIPLTLVLYRLRHIWPFEHFHVVLVIGLYAPIRFCLDFLRASETTYFGLTPGQYFSVAMFVTAIGLAVWDRRRGAPRSPPVAGS